MKLASAQGRERRCSLLNPFCFRLNHKPARETDWVNSSWTPRSQPEFPLPHSSLHLVPHLPRSLLHPEIPSAWKDAFAACKLKFVLLLESCLLFLLCVSWGRKHFLFNHTRLHSGTESSHKTKWLVKPIKRFKLKKETSCCQNTNVNSHQSFKLSNNKALSGGLVLLPLKSMAELPMIPGGAESS